MQFTEQELSDILRLHELWCDGKVEGVKANLNGVNLEKADLKEANLEKADLKEANLEKADLKGANLNWANLKGANLEKADLKGANLEGVDLKGANLKGANLDYACWPLWCGSLGAVGDEGLCAQLAYHLARLMQNSGIEVGPELADLANKAEQIERHNLPKIGASYELPN